MITSQTRILATGCGGMLGEAIYLHFRDICSFHATDIDLNDSWLSYLDVRDINEVRKKVLEIKPDYIFHLAALTDMEFCERNPLEAYKTNAHGTENAALICKEFNIPLVYITTAGTFDGKQKDYIDYEIPNPLSIYGKSKYAGEVIVKQFLKDFFIFRPSWMVGGGPKKDKKFVNKIIKQIKNGVAEIFVVDDKFGTPTYTYDFAKIINKVIDLNIHGVFNCACEGEASRYEVAEEILKIKKLQNKVELNRVSSSYFQNEYFAMRPQSEILINLRLKFLGISIPRDWRVCLEEYMNKYDWGI